MGPANCAVVGCYNNTQKLTKWKESNCEIHVEILHKHCGCAPPFRLYMFPSIKTFSHKREIWVKLLKRQTADKKEWQPRPSDRVCSEHFVDQVPSVDNPNPALKLGYDKKEEKSRRKLFRKVYTKPSKESHTLTSPRQPLTDVQNDSNAISLLSPASSTSTLSTNMTPFTSPVYDNDIISPASSDHSYFTLNVKKCDDCKYKDEQIKTYKKQVENLTHRVRILRQEVRRKEKQRKPMSSSNIKTDEKMNFYTGLSSILLFNSLFALLEPFLKKITYWRGQKHNKLIKMKVNKRTFIPSTQKKLSPKDEFLLTLMRLRLGLLNEDLADRFNISPTSCSNTFKTWLRFLNETLGKALVAWLPKESILENLPQVYRKAGYSKVRVIIDCSEIFIERPKALDTQSATWSDYKHHNTLKFLIGISPTGFITFVSDCYGGRASDKFICQDSDFYDCLEPYDEVMADRGFQITEELMLRYCTLTVPPGARLKSQMTTKECKVTKEVANLRIHIERAINRVKTYRILKNILPITMLHHSDDIVRTCAALCNLKSLLFKKAKTTE